MADIQQFTVSMDLQDGYRFLVDFQQDGVPTLVVDEPAPLGAGQGPNAARLLAAAVGNCLSASALFCLRRARIPVRAMHTRVVASLVRNDDARLRVGGLHVQIEPQVDAADVGRIRRCLTLFEDYCVVTQSVRSGLEVTVEVTTPASGQPSAAGGTGPPSPATDDAGSDASPWRPGASRGDGQPTDTPAEIVVAGEVSP
jgi:organic hydroperoxide reductase OsmC/OhrA